MERYINLRNRNSIDINVKSLLVNNFKKYKEDCHDKAVLFDLIGG